MKGIQQWLDEYSVSHKNPTNKAIHWICIPLIFFSVVGLLYSIPVGYNASGFPVNIATVTVALVTLYYLLLSRTLWIGMLLFSALCVYVCYVITLAGVPLWLVSVITFVLAWIGQFYGHNVEGKKPSFFKDLQFLMIGPAWLMSFIYKKIGIAV